MIVWHIMKSTRAPDPDTILTAHPFDIKNMDPNDPYDYLRMVIYLTEDDAQDAALEAGKYNPVGFVAVPRIMEDPRIERALKAARNRYLDILNELTLLQLAVRQAPCPHKVGGTCSECESWKHRVLNPSRHPYE